MGIDVGFPLVMALIGRLTLRRVLPHPVDSPNVDSCPRLSPGTECTRGPIDDPLVDSGGKVGFSLHVVGRLV